MSNPDFSHIDVRDDLPEAQGKISGDALENLEKAQLAQIEAIYEQATLIHKIYASDENMKFLRDSLAMLNQNVAITMKSVNAGVKTYEQANPILLGLASKIELLKEWIDQAELIEAYPTLSAYLTALEKESTNG